MPRERLLRFSARCAGVHLREGREPAEVSADVVSRRANDREVQMTPDDAGYLAERYALVGDRVIDGVLSSAFEGETVEPRRIAAVNARPPVFPVAYIRGYAVFAGKPDDDRDETVVAFAVNGRGEPNYGDAYTARSRRGRDRLGVAREVHRVGIADIVLRYHASWCDQPNTGGDDERPVRPGQCGAQRLDGTPLDRAVFGEAREIMVEGSVDDGVRGSRAGAQALEIFETPTVRGDPGRSEGGRSSFGAR